MMPAVEIMSVEHRRSLKCSLYDPDIGSSVYNLVADCVGIKLTTGTNVIFGDVDWLPAEHTLPDYLCHLVVRRNEVTVECFGTHI